MKSLPILFLLVVACLAVAAGARKFKPCGKWTTTTTTSTTQKPTTTAEASTTQSTAGTTTTQSTAGTTTTQSTAGTTTTSTGQTDTTSTLSAATRSSETTTMRTTPQTSTGIPSPALFNCTVSDPACGNMCGDVTSTTTGVVQSPNFPGDYGKDSNYCLVIITAPEGWMIQLKFTTFNLETDVGYVGVNDGSIYLLPPTTGNTLPALAIVTTNTMFIGYFSSSSNKPTSAIYNWQATFSVTSEGNSCSVNDPACGNMCTNVTSAGTGVVQSPNFPGDYGNEDRNCLVTIVVPPGKRIQLTFTTFNLETGYSFIYVVDSATVYLPSVTGSSIPADVSTSSNLVYLQFRNYVGTKPNTAVYNWQATYTAVTV